MTTNYSVLNVPTLRSLLKDRNLVSGGNKPVLIARLEQDDATRCQVPPPPQPVTGAVTPRHATSSTTASTSQGPPPKKKVKRASQGPSAIAPAATPTPSVSTSRAKASQLHPIPEASTSARMSIPNRDQQTASTSSRSSSEYSTQLSSQVIANTFQPIPNSAATAKASTPSSRRLIDTSVKSTPSLSQPVHAPKELVQAPTQSSSTVPSASSSSSASHRTPAFQASIPPPKARIGFKSPLLSKSASKPIASTTPTPVPTQDSQVSPLQFLKSSWLESLWEKLLNQPSSTKLAFNLISSSLFSYQAKFSVALKFSISMIYTTVLSSDTIYELLKLPQIVGCEFVVDGICKVITKSREGGEEEREQYILGATGEVVGTIEVLGEEKVGLGEKMKTGLKLRQDWEDYIQGDERETLLSLVRSSDGNNFPGGVSKLCRKRMENDEEMKGVCETFLLSNATPNSISGPHFSSISEALSLSGIPVSSPAPTLYQCHTQRLEFYLPPAHYVESVHFPKELGPDLAVISTASGSKIVLRETGQVIGCEEEGGVGFLWKELLGL